MQGRCCCFSKVTTKHTQLTPPNTTMKQTQSLLPALLLEPFLRTKIATTYYNTWSTNFLSCQIAKNRTIFRSHIQVKNNQILKNLTITQTSMIRSKITTSTNCRMNTTRPKESTKISRERMEREVKLTVTLNPKRAMINLTILTKMKMMMTQWSISRDPTLQLSQVNLMVTKAALMRAKKVIKVTKMQIQGAYSTNIL